MSTTSVTPLIAAQSVSVGTQKIPWFLPHVGEEELALVAETITGNFINMGPRTREFERQVAALLEVKHAVAVTSGTAAITLALMAAGVGQGDEVIVPAITFVGSASAIKLAGGTPVLADIRRQDFNIDPERLASYITPRTKAVMPVHINGRYADLGALRRVLQGLGRADIVLVEDAAEALCSCGPDGYMGTLGITGATSFAPTKIITSGQGGMVFTQDDAVAERVVRLRDQGRVVHNSDEHDTVGYNFKFTDMQAAVGLAQLAKLPDRLERVKAIYHAYAERLAGIEGLTVVPYNQRGGEVPVWTDIVCADRDGLYQHLLGQGVSCRPFWKPIHRQPPYRRPDSEFPNAVWAHRHAMWLPGGPTLTDAQQDRVIELIRGYYGRS